MPPLQRVKSYDFFLPANVEAEQLAFLLHLQKVLGLVQGRL